eukprot:scaffold151204_cov31-Tisochrysis_lutea.AAC.4
MASAAACATRTLAEKTEGILSQPSLVVVATCSKRGIAPHCTMAARVASFAARRAMARAAASCVAERARTSVEDEISKG